MSTIPVIEVGTGNQSKVITPALLTAIGPTGQPVALKADANGQILTSGGGGAVVILDCVDMLRLSGSVFTSIVLSGFTDTLRNGTYTLVGYSDFFTGAEYSNGSASLIYDLANFISFRDNISLTSTDGLLTFVNISSVPVPGTGTKTEVTFQPGQIVRVIDQGNRIEQYLGVDASVNENWVVLRNTVELSLYNAGTFPSDTLYIGNMDVTFNPYVGWVDPDAISVTNGVPFDLGNILLGDEPYGQNLNFGVAYGDIPWQRVSVPYANGTTSVFSMPINLPPRARLTIAIRDFNYI